MNLLPVITRGFEALRSADQGEGVDRALCYEVAALVRSTSPDTRPAWSIFCESLRPGRAITVVYEKNTLTGGLRCRAFLEATPIPSNDVHRELCSFNEEFVVLKNIAAWQCALVRLDHKQSADEERWLENVSVSLGARVRLSASARQPGFVPAQSVRTPTLHMTPFLRTGLQPSLELLLRMTFENPGLRLAVRAEGIALRDAQLQTVRAASKHLRAIDGTRLEATDEADLCQQLTAWLVCQTGITYAATLAADAEGLAALAAVRRLLPFGTRPALTAREVDLANAVCGKTQSIDLLPPDVLNACGMRRVVGSSERFSTTGVELGRVVHASSHERVVAGLDDRYRHTYILGSSGAGKSSLLARMAAQDLDAGRALVLLDPHGELAETVLQLIPEHRAEDVMLVDVGERERSVGLNILDCPGTDQRDRDFVCGELLSAFSRIYDMQVVGGPMFEQYMRHAILLALARTDRPATFLDVIWLFQNPSYRRRLIEMCSDALITDFWTREAERAGGDAALNNMAPYVCSKLNRFAANATIRRLFGQPRTSISIDDVINRRGILIVSLGAGGFSLEETRFVGMLLLSQLLAAAFRRRSKPPADRAPVCVYVDEAQYFASTTLATAMSESRKYGLLLTLAHQNCAQLASHRDGDELAETVIANCSSLLLFRTGLADAIRMERLMAPEFSARDLQSLPNFEIAARLLVGGHATRPFTFVTEPLGPGSPAVAGLVRDLNERYTRPISAIDHEIACLHSDARCDVARAKPGECRSQELTGESVSAE